MNDRTALGAADLDDDCLLGMVAALHGVDAPGALLDVEVVPVDYDLEAITTAARHWVRGRVEYADEVRTFNL